MKLNRKEPKEQAVTHEGGRAAGHIDVMAQLERRVATCLLFENTFYEAGSDIAAGIAALVEKAVKGGDGRLVADLAQRAREEFKLRHVPLFLVRELARHEEGRPFVCRALALVVQRPDEMGEMLALYQKDAPKGKKQPLAASVKKGLAAAFQKFSEYQLAKWDRKDAAYRLRDVLFLVHARPKDKTQANLWKRLVEDKLDAPDTWEVALSAGKDKRGTWERLIREEALGIIALLMNCRNMVEAKCDLELVGDYIRKKAPNSKALPFRFLSAAQHAPALADALNDGLLAAAAGIPKLAGRTAVLVDVSGSMDGAKISAKSELTRRGAAAALAVLCREVCRECRVFTFASGLNAEIPAYRGLPLAERIMQEPSGGTYLAQALHSLAAKCPDLERIIVVTDEQTHDGIVAVRDPQFHGYIVNVAPYAPALDVSGGWARVNGWSERILDWIRYHETGHVGEAGDDE